jgi:Cu+-exporting ATPase
MVDGRDVLVGRAKLFTDNNITVPDDLIRATELAGQTAVLVGWDGHARGLVTIADTIKPTSADVIICLRHWG